MQSARRADRAPGADGGAGQPGLVRTLTMRTPNMRTHVAQPPNSLQRFRYDRNHTRETP